MGRSTVDSPEPGTLLDGERKVLELIATGASLETSLDTLCRVIDTQSGLQSSIFLLDKTATRLSLAAGPHLPEVWRAVVGSFPVTQTACGAAVLRRTQIVSPDIAVDPMYAGYHDAARAAGFRAVWSTPFFSKAGSPLGTFAAYSREIGPPSTESLALIGRATHLASIAVERQQTEESLRESEHLMRTVLDALPVGVAVMDRTGAILLSNPASQHIWGEVIRVGSERYERSRARWHDTGRTVRQDEWASVRALSSGEPVVGDMLDIDAFDGTHKIIQNSAVPIRDADCRVTGAVIVNEDITARTRVERERNDAVTHLRELTARLMHAQDDERRRIAQLLHETTAQDLAGMKMLLASLKRTVDGISAAGGTSLDESIELADRAMGAVRTLSYLLHPPFLDEAGLLSAVRWYANGFSARSGISVDLELPASLARLPQDVETTLFRVVQEALINIHRHAGSSTARIRLQLSDAALTLHIEDHGKGMAPALIARVREGSALGVGIAGMRARLKQLGGTLDIDSGAQGTTVRASAPFAANRS